MQVNFSILRFHINCQLITYLLSRNKYFNWQLRRPWNNETDKVMQRNAVLTVCQANMSSHPGKASTVADSKLIATFV